jgi:hypothetical protein
MNNITKIIFPSVNDVILTNLSLSEVTQRLSTLFDQKAHDAFKPYAGEIHGTYFKIYRKKDFMESRLRIYTEGNIVERPTGCSIELASGPAQIDIIIYILLFALIWPVFFNNFLLSLIATILIGSAYFLSTAVVKEQGNKHLQLIRKTIESPIGYDGAVLRKADYQQGMRWIVIYAVSILGTVLVCVFFAMWMNTWDN